MSVDEGLLSSFQTQYKLLFDILKDSKGTRKDLMLELFSKKLISEYQYDLITEKEVKSTSDEVADDILKMIRTIFKALPEKSEEVLNIMEKDILLKNIVHNIRKEYQSLSCEIGTVSKRPQRDTLDSALSSKQIPHSLGMTR